ncbi:MAG: packaged DNA stabilization protein [Pseudomonadota bacterium]
MIPFVGPSYNLATPKADIQRAINLMLVGLETPGKAPFIMQSVPGLIQRWQLVGSIRGTIETNTRAYAVAGSTLYELHADYTSTVRGTLATSTGDVSMAYGLFQVVMVDGPSGYVFTEATDTLAQIAAAGFPGANRVDFCDNYFVFTRDRDGQQYQISAINNALAVDALDFASSESSPDDLVGHLVVQAGILLFGLLTCELHVNTGASDFPFERSRGSGFRVGLMACHSLREIDNGAMWLGRDETGSGIVYRLAGGQAQRVSTQAVEQALQASTDLTQATAYTYQDKGLTVYCINAPGLLSTWCYEVSSGAWHERCELDANGFFLAGRATHALFAFDRHFVGDATGAIYELSGTTYTNAGDPLVRERISPHSATRSRYRIDFGAFWIDCSTGEAAQGDTPHVELSYSNDSGARWSTPQARSQGAVGERFSRLLWQRCGMGRDRVTKVRFSGNAPFSIMDGGYVAPKELKT